MKNDSSFKILALAVLAALVLSVVDASSSRESSRTNPEPASASLAILVQR